MEARAAALDKKLTEAVGVDTEQAAVIAADLNRVRELIATTKELRRASIPGGRPCGASALAERHNRESEAEDTAQFKFESERRLARVDQA